MTRTLLIAAIFFIFNMGTLLKAQVSPKRGMAYGYHTPQDLDAVKTGASWWYNWSSTPDAGIASYYSSQGVEFVPMLWNDNYTVANIIANMPAGAKYILAFNEPNFNVESNMTPAQAAAAWPKIEQIAAAKNLQIVSAAPAYCGGGVCIPGYTDPVQWHDDFFAICPTCKVDYIAFHNYEPTVGALLFLTNNLKKYNLPIWVTEFAYWDPAASNAAKTTYLQQAVSAFENDPDIYRYSWFTGRSGSNSTIDILGANGTLTSLGSAYINAAYGPKNNIPGKIEVEKVYRRKGTGLQATTDVGGGQNVGYTDPGTWNEYLVNISTTGSYTFKFRVASNVTGGSFSVKLDGAIVKSNVTIPNTGGWQSWVDYDVTGIVLPAGEHLLKFDFTVTGTNMNYFTTIYESSVPPNANFSATPLSTCVGNQVVFTDLTTNKITGETYAWNFGANAIPATATGIGPHTVTYSAGGQKTTSLTVTNANGSNTQTKNNYVTVATPPTGCLFSDDYNNSTVNWINPIPGAFNHAESGTNWTVSNAGYGEWQNFTYTLNNGTIATPINFQCAANKPIVKIRARASANCLLSLTMLDANGRAIDNTNVTNLELTTAYQTFTIDFSNKFRNYYGGDPGILDSTNIDRLQLAVNPGYFSYPITGANGVYNAAFGGTLDIDWIGVGANCNAPVSPPTISSFTPACGSPATSVTIIGTNLTGATAVLFNGVAATIINNTANQIIVTAPAGVSAGLITVQTPNGNVNTVTSFNVFPSQPSIITAGIASPCPSSIGNIYSVTNVAGVSYAWVYSGTGATITAGTGTSSITVTYASAINGTWTVTPSNTCGNGIARTLGVVLNTVPLQPSIIAAGTANPCPSSLGNIYSVTNVAGVSYAWVYSGTGATITAGTGTSSITVTYASAINGTWTVTPSNTCGNGITRTLGVVLNTVPLQPSIIAAGTANPCPSSIGNIYSVTNVAGVSYAWVYSGTGATITAGTGTSSITVTYASAINGTWTVTPSNTCGNGIARTLGVVLGATPATPGAITGTTTLIQNTTGNAFSIAAVSGATSYNWTYSGTGGTINGSGIAVTLDLSALATGGTLSVTATNACGTSSSSNVVITVNAATVPQPGAFTASIATLCQGVTGIVYTVPNVGGTTYNWTYSGAGFTITSGAGTNSIVASFSGASTSGTLSVVAQVASATSAARTMFITLNSVPSQPSIITAVTASPCPSSLGNIYSVTNVAGVSYAWVYSGTGATITAGTGTSSITVTYASASNGTWTVTPSNTCGNGTTRTLGVVLGATPATPGAITGTTTLFQNTTGNAFSISAVAGATTYNWSYTGAGGTINGSGISITLDLSNTATGGDLRVSATNTCGTSIASAQTITVNNPSVTPQPGVFTTSSATVCQEQQGVVYTVPNIGGTTYMWTYSGADAIINGSGNSVTVDFGATATSGTLSVVANDGSGNSTPRSMFITVNIIALQPSSITGLSSVSAGQSNVTYSVSNQLGVTFNWTYTGSGATVVSGQGTNVISMDYSSISTAGNLNVTAMGVSCGTSLPSTLSIQILPVLGVSDFEAVNQSLKIYPNPAAAFITVELNLSMKERVDLGIYDILGSEVKPLLHNEYLNSSKYTFSIEDLSYGMYFVKVTAGTESRIVKLIKN